MGHSTGAQSVLRTALLAPERVAGLVLFSPTFDPPARKFRILVRRAVETLRREDPGEIGVVAPSYLSGGVQFFRFLRTALLDRPEDIIANVSVPILVITGEDDPLAPPSWAQHLATLASARLVVMPGAHNACYPYPSEADAALRQAVELWTQKPNHD